MSTRTGAARILSHLRMRLAGCLSVQVGVVLVSVVGLLALAAIAADAVFVLSADARVHAPWALAAAAAAVALAGVAALLRLGELRVARRFEREEPRFGNQLTNAVLLSSGEGGTAVGELLRLQAVELGRFKARGAKAWPVVRRGVMVACILAAATLLLWGSGPVFFGGVLRAVIPRFLDPHGDHPPYSRLQIEVVPGDASVLYGGQCEVRAMASGLPVEELYLVAQRGDRTTRALMFVASDHAFFQTVVNLREETVYYVTDGRARSHRHTIHILRTPQITLLELKADFPAYTATPSRAEQLTGEALLRPIDKRLPLGTVLTFRVASNRPLASGTLTLTPVMGGKETAVPLEAEGQGSVVRGGFTVAEAVAFTITVKDAEGLPSTEPRQGRVTLLPDEPPTLAVLEPGKNALATPNVVIPIRVAAEDDYAVTSITWFRGHNRSIERPLEMKLQPAGGPKKVEAAAALDLGALGVRPGDLIEYFFEAVDNFPQGPNIATSRIFRIQVISMKDYEEMLRRAAANKALFETYRKLGNWLRRLAERAEDLDKKTRELAQRGGGTPEEQAALKKEAEELAADMDRYLNALRDTLKQPKLFDIEDLFRKQLASQGQAMAALRKQLADMLASGAVTVEGTRALTEGLTGLTREEQEQIGRPLEHLIAAARLIAKAQTFVRLTQQQEQVVHLAARFKDQTDKPPLVQQRELEDLGRGERSIRADLEQLLGELPELVEQLPDDPAYDPLRESVNGFIDGVLNEKIREDLDAAGKSFIALNGKLASPYAEDALEKMNKFITRCQAASMLGMAKQCMKFQPMLAEAMGRTLEQLVAAMGAGSGGTGDSDGYGLFASDTVLYGPDMELAGQQGGRDTMPHTGASAERRERSATDAADPELGASPGPARVKLQRDAKFPLRYRTLVGEYFRAVAESGAE